jgi:hypothetical protein
MAWFNPGKEFLCHLLVPVEEKEAEVDFSGETPYLADMRGFLSLSFARQRCSIHHPMV